MMNLALLEEGTFECLSMAFGNAKAQQVIDYARKMPDSQRYDVLWSVLNKLKTADPASVKTVSQVSEIWMDKIQTVDVVTFLEDPFYLGLKGEIYPEIMNNMIEVNSGKYDEAVFTGAIGTAKTTMALWTNAYQLYKLSLMPDPQGAFGLDHSSEILFVFQSISASLAKAVDYSRFQALIHGSKYFTQIFPYNSEIESELRFPRRIIVKPVSGDASAAIGQNVFGGVIDEVNYMAKVEDSKLSMDGGTYDQAVALYNSIARRRKSRFMKAGLLPGILCIVSSKRYPGQFTDVKEAEARKEIKEKGFTKTFIYDKRTWEVLPKDRFSGEWFRVFIGDDSRQPRILDDGEVLPQLDDTLVMPVPLEYKNEFESDIMDALREIGGVSTLASHPFFTNREAVAAAFGKVESIVTRDTCDFVRTKLGLLVDNIKNHDRQRWVHIDLALTSDKAGMAMGYVDSFKQVDRGDGHIEVMPNIIMDFTLRVQAPPSGEIQFEKLRRLLYMLRDEQQVNIRWVTCDGFQSADLLQILRTKGFACGQISMDKDDRAYSLAKGAFYDGRVAIPLDPHCQREFSQLEVDVEKAKIDHPPNGSKDVADAVAGVISGLTMRREVWVTHGIPTSMIPERLVRAVVKGDNVRVATKDEMNAYV